MNSPDGLPNASVATGAPRMFWSPDGVGRTTTGQPSAITPPPARNPASATTHVAGRPSVTTRAATSAVRHPMRRVIGLGDGEGAAVPADTASGRRGRRR